MKKLILILLALTLMFSLAACQIGAAETIETTEPVPDTIMMQEASLAPVMADTITEEDIQNGVDPDEVIVVCEHTYKNEVKLAPTCEESGILLYKCSKCGDEYEEVMEALGHDIVDTVIPPTCTEQGSTIHHCKRCDYSVQDSYVEATGHNIQDIVINPTCEERGYTLHKCANPGCSYRVEDHYTDAIGHDIVDSVVAPTCTERGYDLHQCSRCEYKTTDTYTNALGHDMKNTTVSPTCTEKGYTLHKCNRCGYETKDNYTEALGHNYKNYYCTRCGQMDPNAPQIYDINAAMAAGNTYAKSLGFEIDYSLNAGNSAYRPSDRFSGNYLNNNGGQNRLNQLAKESVDLIYNWLNTMEYFEEGFRGRCYIEYDNASDNYEIWFFFE